MIRSFSDSIFGVKIIITEAEENHSNLLEHGVEFNNKSRPITKVGKMKRRNTFESVNALYVVEN